MGYYTREDQDKAIKAYIDDLQEAVNLFTAVRDVVQEFDGKVFNCRFEKALQDKSERRIYAKKEHSRINIYIYTTPDIYTLASVQIKDMKDGKRINADLFLESARQYRDERLKEISEARKAAENIDQIKSQIKQLENAIYAITGTVKSYRVKEIYGLNVRITH